MKIALLITGQIRFNRIYFNNLIKKYNIDVFLSSDYKYGKRHSNRYGPGFKNKNIKIENKFISTGNIINIEELNITNLKKINLEKMKLFNEYSFINQTILDACYEQSNNKHTVIGTVYHMYHINKCLEMMLEYEKKHGKYDIIIKIRPDLYFDYKINNLYKIIKQNKFIISKHGSNVIKKKNNFLKLSDKLWIANRQTFLDFIEKMNIYKNHLWKKDYSKEIKLKDFNSIPIGERLIWLIIKKYNIDYFILDDNNTEIIRK